VKKRECIFVVDPMCSWCWGFAPVMERMRGLYSNEVAFSLVLGGLRGKGEMVWNEEAKNYLRTHWQQVSQRTGQLFDETILDKEQFVYDTHPACRAVVAVRELMGRDAAFVYLHKIQEAFYTQGIDITNVRLLQGYYEQLFGNSAKFAYFYLSERGESLMVHDFAKARSMGATVFPSVVLIDEEGHMVCQKGYKSEKEMKRLLEADNA
jgi:putative protein-disulfide isomerase